MFICIIFDRKSVTFNGDKFLQLNAATCGLPQQQRSQHDFINVVDQKDQQQFIGMQMFDYMNI